MGRDAARLFNYMTGYARPEQMEKIAFAPVTLRPDALQPDRRRDRQCQGRQAGRDLGQAQLAGRRRADRPALCRLAGRRADRSRGPRHLLPAARRAGPERATSGSRASSAASSSMRASSASATASRCRRPTPRCSSRRPTGCRATSTAASSCSCPVENPTVHEQVLDQIMVANLKDDGQSWIMAPDGSYSRPPSGQGTFHRPSLFHDKPVAFGPRQRAETERRRAAAGAELLRLASR